MQVNSEKSYSELHSYCAQFGEINAAHHYNIQNDDLHYILLEYANQQNVNNALQSSQFIEDGSGVPVHSPFLWFRAGKIKPKIIKSNVSLTNKYCNDIMPEDDLVNLIQSADSVSDQIIILFRSTCLNDLGIRLRFLAAQQIENSVMGMFPGAQALPFGSSVNGFGKMGCDLDLILRFESESKQNTNDGNSRLVFHSKEHLTNGRSQNQRQMESIGDMMHLFLPGVGHVRRILQARIPIIKYHHDHLDLEVDLSMGNMTGFYMSEIFYMFGQLDERVRPLTFCIRKWANSSGLTNPSPGRWISNFSLTALVLFYLQQLKDPILPPINYLTKHARKTDIRITEDINCTFLRDLKVLNFKTKNSDSLETLLLQFFEYYSQFDFHNKAISLNDGKTVLKPDHSAIYIVNPLQTVLNVSKNISFEELERFRIEVRNAAWVLESNTMQNLTKDTNWGILNILQTKTRVSIKPSMFFKPRMVEVSELFGENIKNENLTSPSSSQQQDDEFIQNDKIEYKNNFIKQQVGDIKFKTRQELKQIKERTLKKKQ